MPHPRHPKAKASLSAARVPQKTCTWIVAVRQLDIHIPIGKGDTLSPYVTVIADVTQEIFINMIPSEQRPTVAEVGEMLFGSMAQPGAEDVEPYRPERVEFEQAEFVSPLSAALWELQITTVAGEPHPIVDEVIKGLSAALNGSSGPETPGLLSVAGVTPHIVEQLILASSPFYRLTPWNILSDTDALLVRFEPSGEQRYAQLMGESGMEIGLALYRRWEDLLQIYVPTDDPMTNVPEDGLHALSFVDKRELPDEDQQAIKRYHWKGTQKTIYPMPLVMTREGALRPDRQEILFYEALMRAIPILIREHLREDSDGEFLPFEADVEVPTADGPMRMHVTYPAGEFPADFFLTSLDMQDVDWEDEDDEDEDDWDEVEVKIPLTSAQQKAADLSSQAWRADNEAERRRLALEAIQAAPDHPEAYLILAQIADSAEESLRWYRQGLEEGQKLVTQEWIDQAGGDIGRIPEGETLTILKRGLADTLVELGQLDEAIALYNDLLEDDPLDAGEVRFDLLALLLRLKRDDEARELLEDFEDMLDVYAEYAWALIFFRKDGNSAEARRALKKAIKANPLVIPFLVGRKPLPIDLDDLEEDDFVAATLAREYYQSWWSTPGAVDWLKKYGE